jgi:hypothetical protein
LRFYFTIQIRRPFLNDPPADQLQVGGLCYGLRGFQFRVEADGMQEHIAEIVEDVEILQVDAALANVTRDAAARAEHAALRAAAEGAPEIGGNPGAVFGGVKSAEGGGREAREAAAAPCGREMVAACIVFATASSGLRPAF